jgi:glycosyltransferase involved in cell wall biosynthesis
MTLTEAAACGTPAVASDIAGHRDSVAPGLSGLLAGSNAAFV